MKESKVKRVEDSMVETVHIVRPTHLNPAGRLFGGVLMQWIDEAAGIVAKRHCMSNITTASVDNLRFIRGAYQDDMVVIRAKMTYAGWSSMEIRVDTYVEDLTGIRKPINRAYFTVVALDETDRPKEVPGLLIETENEKAEWEGALKRRENRLMRKEEEFKKHKKARRPCRFKRQRLPHIWFCLHPFFPGCIDKGNHLIDSGLFFLTFPFL